MTSILSLRVFGEDLSPVGPFVKNDKKAAAVEDAEVEEDEGGVVAQAEEVGVAAEDEEASMNL
jgi:hypothetical protein